MTQLLRPGSSGANGSDKGNNIEITEAHAQVMLH